MKIRFLAALIPVVVLLLSCRKEDDNKFINPNWKDATSDDLPQLHITTPQKAAVQSKTEWMDGAKVSLVSVEGEETDLGESKIKGRGNTTWSYPKKPYTLKLETEASPLGMPSGKRWNLLANYIDRTDMRNAIAFEVAHRTKSLEWTPHGEFVELYLNSVWQGNYYLCEHIKIDKNRLNLHKGGYVLELDVYFDEEFKFKSDLLGLPVQVKDWKGDDMTEKRLEEIRTEFNEIEALLVSDDRAKNGWQDYLDMDTFIDWWFVYELVQCGEPGHPKSSYMYRDKGGKLKAGPVWDFDWGTFTSDNVNKFRDKKAIFYSYLFKDPSFVKRVKEKWNESKNEFRSVTEFIDKTEKQINSSVNLDKGRWKMTTTINGDESMSFEGAVAKLKENYIKHWEWMDKQIAELK